MVASFCPVIRLALVNGVLLFLNRGRWRPATRLDAPFTLSRPEGAFARELLAQQTQYWLFRTHQQHRAGDFIAVDRSRPLPGANRCFAIELKSSARLSVGWRGTQLSRCDRAASWLQRQHAVNLAPVVPIVGERADLLALLRNRRRQLDVSHRTW